MAKFWPAKMVEPAAGSVIAKELSWRRASSGRGLADPRAARHAIATGNTWAVYIFLVRVLIVSWLKRRYICCSCRWGLVKALKRPSFYIDSEAENSCWQRSGHNKDFSFSLWGNTIFICCSGQSAQPTLHPPIRNSVYIFLFQDRKGCRTHDLRQKWILAAARGSIINCSL